MEQRQTALFAPRLLVASFIILTGAACGDLSVSDTALNEFEHAGGVWETDDGFSHIVYDGNSYGDSITDCMSTEYDFALMFGECYEYASIPYALGAVTSGGTMDVENQSTGSWATMDASSFLDFNGLTPGIARVLCYTDKPEEYKADCEVENDYDSFAPDFYMEIDTGDYNTITVYRGSASSGLGEVFLGKDGDYNCDGVDTPDATVRLVRTSLAYDSAIIELLGEGGHVTWPECMPDGWYDEPEDTGGAGDTGGDTGMAGTGESEEVQNFQYPPMFYITKINALWQVTPQSQQAYQATADSFFEEHHPELYGSDIHLFVMRRIDAYFTDASTRVFYDTLLNTMDLAVALDLQAPANKIFGHWIKNYRHWEANRQNPF